MKKILHINHYYNKGGAETVFKQTCEFIKKNTKSYICHTDKKFHADIYLESFEEKKFFKVFNYIFNFNNFFKLRRFLKNNELDIIHLHSYTAMSPSVLLCLKFYKKQTKIIQTIHDYHIVCPNNSLYNFKENIVCKKCLGKKQKINCFKEKCEKRGTVYLTLKYVSNKISSIIRSNNLIDRYLVPSIFLKNILVEEGIDSKKIEVTGNPIDIRVVRDIKKEDRIVYFGRLEKEKGIKEILVNFAKFLDKNKQFKLDIIGSGKEEIELKKIVKDLNIEKNVYFLGKLNGEELRIQISKAKMSIMNSSWYETFGLTPLESIIQDTIPIVRDSGATKEVMGSLEIGVLYVKEDEILDCLEKINYSYNEYLKNLLMKKTKLNNLNEKYFKMLIKEYRMEEKKC